MKSRSSDQTGGNSETQPLLAQDVTNESGYISMPQDANPQFKKQRNNRLKKLLITLVPSLLILLGVFIVINVYYVAQRSEEFANQSVEMDIQHVELRSITTEGVNVEVLGVNVINYNGIKSGYFRNLFKMGGSAFQTAKINLQTVDLETVIDEERITIGTVDIPEFTVNTGNGQSTPLDMIVSIHPNTGRIFGLLKHILKHPDEITKIYGSAVLQVTLGLIPLGNFRISFEQDIIGNNYIQFNGDDIKIQNLTFSETENKDYNIRLNANLPNPIQKRLFALHIPVLGWELLVNGCDKNPTISLFDHPIYTDPLKISPMDEEINIAISTKLSKLNNALITNCKVGFGSGETPMATIIDEIVNNKSLPVLVNNVEGSEEYPGFVNDLLRLFSFQFEYLSKFSTSKIIENISINRLNFAFKNGDMNKPVINGEINLYLRIPRGLTTVTIANIKGITSLFHNDVEFGQIIMNEWHSCSNEVSEDSLHVKLILDNEELKIKDRDMFGRVLNEVISKGKTTIFIDALLDCFITSLVGNFEINQVHASSATEITRGLLMSNGL